MSSMALRTKIGISIRKNKTKQNMVDKTYFLVSCFMLLNTSIFLPCPFLLAYAPINGLVKHFRTLTYENPSIRIKNVGVFLQLIFLFL